MENTKNSALPVEFYRNERKSNQRQSNRSIAECVFSYYTYWLYCLKKIIAHFYYLLTEETKMDKEHVELLILQLIDEREGSLSHYQLTRKLKNLNHHDLVPQLLERMENLEKRSMISPDFSKSSSTIFFSITKAGVLFLEQHRDSMPEIEK